MVLNCHIGKFEIKPYYGCFKIIVVCDDGIASPEAPKESVRIAAIDFGVNNIAAIANNVGLPGLLFKGGVIKAENQWYNKKRASIAHGLTVGHKNPTQRPVIRWKHFLLIGMVLCALSSIL